MAASPSPSPKKDSPLRHTPGSGSGSGSMIQPSSPRFLPHSSTNTTPMTGTNRRIGIAVDLSDESAYAVKWAVQNYLRKGDTVILLHVRPTSVLYGADWGSIDHSVVDTEWEPVEGDAGNATLGGVAAEESQKKMEDDFDNFTNTKAMDLAQPLVVAGLPFKLHIVKDHDMKERLCLEVERLGLSTVVMGSRGFGASKRSSNGRLGSVSDYCVHHCVCPVVVVRLPEEAEDEKDGAGENGGEEGKVRVEVDDEEAVEFHDASDKAKDG